MVWSNHFSFTSRGDATSDGLITIESNPSVNGEAVLKVVQAIDREVVENLKYKLIVTDDNSNENSEDVRQHMPTKQAMHKIFFIPRLWLP